MSRSLSGPFLAALSSGVLRPALFFKGTFADGDLRLWSGLGAITALGEDYAGAGTFLGISTVEETGDVVASGTSISLSGVPSELVSAALDEVRQGLPGRIYIGLLDETGALIDDPVLMFVGRIDVPEIADDEQTCIITISYESRLIDLTRAREWRYTDESQKALYPGDRGFEYVTTIQDKEIVWGR